MVITDLDGLGAELQDDPARVLHKERPRVEQVDLVHHHDDYAVSPLEAARVLAVLQDKRVAQGVATCVVAKEYRTRPISTGGYLT